MILIINSALKEAHSLSDMFYYMGVLSYAATPSEALSEISVIYRAVILMSPDTLPDKEEYVAMLRKYANIPIFAMTEEADREDKMIFDGIIGRFAYSASIIDFLNEYTEKNGLNNVGDYKLAGIDASATLCSPKYFGKAICFTKTETMILRALIITYPRHLDTGEILKYAFKPSRSPMLSNVRTHISIMNRKHRDIIGRNIISFSAGEGYRITAPDFSDTPVTATAN